MESLEKNFILAKKQDRRTQKALYEMFSAKVFAIANSCTNIPNENKGNEVEENIKVNIASQQPLPVNNSVLAEEKFNITDFNNTPIPEEKTAY